MKSIKKVSIFFIFILSLTMIGCNKSEKSSGDLTKTSSQVSNNNQNIFVSEDEEFIYFTDTMTVKKISKTDNSLTQIFPQDMRDAIPISAFESFNDRIYLLLNKTTLVSMDKNGNDILKAEIEINLEKENYHTGITPYIFNDSLYLIGGGGYVYRVTTAPLDLEPRDGEIKYQYIAANKKLFVKRLDNGIGKIYTVDSDGKEHLFSSSDENVVINRTNFTDYYVFYLAYNEDFTLMNMYRVNLDGSNKTLIKSVPVSDFFIDVKYDNSYAYLTVPNGYVKINKETLEETDLTNISGLNEGFLEVIDEKFFCCLGGTYYIDVATGEKTQL